MEKDIFVPGRTELAGNHTDHQKGRILASAVDLGLFASFRDNGGNICHIDSEGFPEIEVRISQLNIRPAEFGTSMALVRGVLAAFQELGLNIGGFDAQVRSSLPAGSGLSSSAAFAVLIGRILSELFNGGKVEPSAGQGSSAGGKPVFRQALRPHEPAHLRLRSYSICGL